MLLINSSPQRNLKLWIAFHFPVSGLDICQNFFKFGCPLLNSLRILECKCILQDIAFSFVSGFQHPESGHIIVHLHFLHDQRVSRRNCLDFSKAQHRFIHILTVSGQLLRCHNLADKALFRFHDPPQISIKRILCNIPVDAYFFILVAVADTSAFSL